MGLRRLYVDIPALIDSDIETDSIECEYMYHRLNPGAESIIEIVEFASYCRQCKEAFCVDACPKDALEHLETGVIKRWNMRCVGCKSCVIACPFGTIFPEVINYVSSKCDYCLNQLDDDPEYIPACVKTAPDGTFKMIDIENEDPEKHIYFCGDHLAVKSPNWRYKEERV
jgi:Fe-S-cluster-containing dehydrogenase component